MILSFYKVNVFFIPISSEMKLGVFELPLVSQSVLNDLNLGISLFTLGQLNIISEIGFPRATAYIGLIFYMATPCHTNESIRKRFNYGLFLYYWMQLLLSKKWLETVCLYPCYQGRGWHSLSSAKLMSCGYKSAVSSNCKRMEFEEIEVGHDIAIFDIFYAQCWQSES